MNAFEVGDVVYLRSEPLKMTLVKKLKVLRERTKGCGTPYDCARVLHELLELMIAMQLAGKAPFDSESGE